MRGRRIFKELIGNAGLQTVLRKGRNNSLVTGRNECLLTRYYYYGYYKNKCYEDILRHLTAEFFLSPATITHIIQDNTDVLRAIKQRSPVLYYLQTHWPHLKW